MTGRRDPFFGFGDPFANFGNFAGPQDLMSSFFGGRDPFADPFFTRPFGGMFESSFFGPHGNPFIGAQQFGFPGGQPSLPRRSGGQSSLPPRSGGLTIEELDSDEERDEKEDRNERKDNPRKHRRSSKEPLVEDPDDEAEGRRRSKQMQLWNGNNLSNTTQPRNSGHSFSFQSSSVTYSGGNGGYYTSSTTRRSGSDGLTFEESKEANSATRLATHRVSRGIYDKGHSVTRKLNSDGRVDTMQTLHNLQEGELAGFEDKWKENAEKHLPGWSEGPHVHDLRNSGRSISDAPYQRALPYVESSHQPGNIVRPEVGHGAGPPRVQLSGKGKTDVNGKSGGSSHVKSRDHARKN